MSADEVADALCTSRHAVYTMVMRGQFPTNCILRLGRRVLFRRAEFSAWIAFAETPKKGQR